MITMDDHSSVNYSIGHGFEYRTYSSKKAPILAIGSCGKVTECLAVCSQHTASTATMILYLVNLQNYVILKLFLIIKKKHCFAFFYPSSMASDLCGKLI